MKYQFLLLALTALALAFPAAEPAAAAEAVDEAEPTGFHAAPEFQGKHEYEHAPVPTPAAAAEHGKRAPKLAVHRTVTNGYQMEAGRVAGYGI